MLIAFTHILIVWSVLPDWQRSHYRSLWSYKPLSLPHPPFHFPLHPSLVWSRSLCPSSILTFSESIAKRYDCDCRWESMLIRESSRNACRQNSEYASQFRLVCVCVLPPKETRLSELEPDLNFACMHMHAVTNIRANAQTHTHTHTHSLSLSHRHTCTHRVLYYGDTDGFSAAQLCFAHSFPECVSVFLCVCTYTQVCDWLLFLLSPRCFYYSAAFGLSPHIFSLLPLLLCVKPQHTWFYPYKRDDGYNKAILKPRIAWQLLSPHSFCFAELHPNTLDNWWYQVII